MNQRLEQPTPLGDSLTSASVHSLDGHQMVPTMSYWLEKISPEDIGKLWTALRACARAASEHITSELWESGTTLRLGFQVDVTASIMPDGSVRISIGEGTSGCDGEAAREPA